MKTRFVSSVSARRILLTSLSNQFGGMESRLAEEARFLLKQGHKPSLAVSPFSGSKEWLEGLVDEGFPVLDFNPPDFFGEWRWRRLRKVLAEKFFCSAIKRQHFDLGHVFYAWTEMGGTRLWLLHKYSIPCVLSIHNTFPMMEFLPWHARLMQIAFMSVRGIYGVSQSALEHFVRIYQPYIRPGTILRVIENFVDIHRFVPSEERRYQIRKELHIPNNALVIGSVGRIDRQKNPMAVIKVFARLQERFPNLYLVLCGQGPMETEVRESFESQSWAERVRLIGFRRDPEAIFNALDLHVMLSLREGLSLSSVECLSCGVPLVATDIPGIRDVLAGSSAGQLVSPSNLDSAAKAVDYYLSSPDARQNAGIAGRQLAEDRFSRERWAEKLRDFYEEVFHVNASKSLF